MSIHASREHITIILYHPGVLGNNLQPKTAKEACLFLVSCAEVLYFAVLLFIQVPSACPHIPHPPPVWQQP